MEMEYRQAADLLENKLSGIGKSPLLPSGLVDLVSRVARRQLEVQRDVCVALPAEADIAKADANVLGKPLLARAAFPFDQAQARSLFQEFTVMLQEAGPDLAEAAKVVSQAVQAQKPGLDEVFARLLEGDDAFFMEFSQKTPAAPRTLNFLAQAALTPSILHVAAFLAKRLGHDEPRRHGHCPVCGSLPLVASLRQKEGLRFAACSFCRTEYRIRRTACPFCDQADPKGFRFFTVKELPGFRVDVCDNCHSYIKTADFRDMDKPSLQALDDLESMPLDILAQKQGFRRATLSAWGF